MTDKARILLVDDDVDFVEATRVVLESKPYEVITAYDGDDGLAKARQERPDLIILDIIMPVKDGFSAAEEFKKDPELSGIPIVVLTSFAEKGAQTSLGVSQGLTLDAEDYVDKPVSPEDLLKRVQKLLKK